MPRPASPSSYLRTLRDRLKFVEGKMASLESADVELIKRGLTPKNTETTGQLQFLRAERSALVWAIEKCSTERDSGKLIKLYESAVTTLRAALVAQDPNLVHRLLDERLLTKEDRIAITRADVLREEALASTAVLTSQVPPSLSDTPTRNEPIDKPDRLIDEPRDVPSPPEQIPDPPEPI